MADMPESAYRVKKLMKIKETIIKATTRCRKRFKCLEKPRGVCCPVEQCVMNRIFFVKPPSGKRCPYKSMMEQQVVCTCPVRNEIFSQYGK